MSVADFASQVRKLEKLAYPKFAAEQRETLLTDHFVAGVGIDHLAVMMCNNAEGTDLHAAALLAHKLEATGAHSVSFSDGGKPVVRRAAEAEDNQMAALVEQLKLLTTPTKNSAGQDQRYRREVPLGPSSGDRGRSKSPRDELSSVEQCSVVLCD